MIRKILLAAFTAACAISTYAGTFTMNWETDKSPVTYAPGDKMVFKVQLLEDGKPVAGKKLKWTRRGDDGKTANGVAVCSEKEPAIIESSIDSPGFVHVAISVLDENGKPVKDAKNQDLKFEGGAGADIAKLASAPEPKDFDEFWKKQKEKLAAVPVKATLAEVPSENPRFVVYDVKIDCAGGKPVSGYFTKPKDAKEKSLSGKVSFMGYGVSSPKPEYRDGGMTLSINAHGIENGKDADYYAKLKDGELKGYAFKNDENANPETSYFNGMMLRVMRALEFVRIQPEWNGKELISAGGSQGGLQAISGAALDPAVTMCYAYKPWCCDLSGINSGRVRGWRPDWADGLAYYDNVNHAKRIKCKIAISSGLGDYVCPPSGVTILYNNISAPKQIDYIQGTTHGYDAPNPKKFTLKKD